MKHLPDTPYPHKGEPDTELAELNSLTKPLQNLARDVAGLMNRHKLHEAVITIDGAGDRGGSVRLTRANKATIKIALSGNLTEAENAHAGTPYVAHYNGEFFWRPTPDSENFVKSGQRVRTGQLVGWAMGESKDISFGLRAETDGVIYLVAKNGSKVKENETTLYYLESSGT